MKYLKLISLLFAVALLFTNCKKNKNELPVEFKFVLLDTLGNEKTVFNQGENIIFSFQVINNSSEDLYIENFLDNNNLFRIYQPNTNGGTLDYGKPYDGICYIGGFFVKANQTLEMKCPWVNSKDSVYHYCFLCEKELHEKFLPVGNYYTKFSQSFKIDKIQTKEKHFKINFKVK